MTLFFQKSTSSYLWLEWKKVYQASGYNVEVALDPEFQQKVFSDQAKSSRYLIKTKLPEGPLFWRIQAFGDGERTSYWSSPRSMTVYSGHGSSPQRVPAGHKK
jgi:hypothetical protein